jgi:hypothetical protein
MSAERSYGRRELIEAYLAVSAGPGYHGYYQDSASYNAALKAHHEAMLDGLQRLYGIRLNMSESPDRVFFMLFDRTAASMIAMTSPMSGFLSASLLIDRLEAAGDQGARVLEASHRIWSRKT